MASSKYTQMCTLDQNENGDSQLSSKHLIALAICKVSESYLRGIITFASHISMQLLLDHFHFHLEINETVELREEKLEVRTVEINIKFDIHTKFLLVMMMG